MFHRAALTGLLAVLLLAMPAAAQNLSWRFEEGDAFLVEEKIVAKTTVTVMGVKSVEEQTQRRLSRFVVKSVSRDETLLQQEILEWKSNVVGGAGGDQDDTQLMEELCKGLHFTLHLSANGALTRFEGFKEFLDRLGKLDSAEAKKFKTVAGEDLLRAPLVQIFDVVPGGVAKKGQKWQRISDVAMGPMGSFKLNTTFTYLDFKDGGHQIDTRATFSFQPGKVDAGALGFRIQKLDLTKNEARGHLVFDSVKGRLVLRETEIPLAGTMVIERMDEQFEVQLDGTETRTIKVVQSKAK
jgi:hypothetical protein